MTEKKTILLVEDEALIAMNEAHILSQQGFEVITALNGEQAIDKVRNNGRIDLVLMDIDLGRGMDGTQAAEIILRDRDVPVVFISNHTEQNIIAKTDKITSYGYVVKNSSDTILFASIKMAFRLHEAKKELISREEKLKLALEERNFVENRLKKEQENFIKMFSAAPIGLVLLDHELTIIRSNKAMGSIIRSNPFEITGKRIGNGLGCMFSTESVEGCGFAYSCQDCLLRKTITHVFATKTGVNNVQLEPVLFMVDRHEKRWINLNAEPVTLNGEAYIILTLEDISERKQSETALEESRYFISRILEATPNLIYTYDLTEKRNKYTNREIQDFLGYSSEEIMEMGPDIFPSILHPEDAPTVIAHHHNLLTCGDNEVHEVEYRMKNSDGTWHWLRSRDVPFSRGKDGKVNLILGSADDVTRRKEMEDDLTKAVEEKDTLLMELQHRAKNTLSIISGIIGLEANHTTDENARTIMQRMKDRISSLARLYDMLYLSMNIKTVRLDDYIREIAHSLIAAYSSEFERINLEMTLTEMIIDTRRAIPIGLIINEIVTNSVKYAFSGGSGGKIRIGLEKEYDHVIITLSDNGKWVNLETEGKELKNQGMFLVHVLTEQISGQISNVIGNGTQFRISFPFAEYE